MLRCSAPAPRRPPIRRATTSGRRWYRRSTTSCSATVTGRPRSSPWPGTDWTRATARTSRSCSPRPSDSRGWPVARVIASRNRPIRCLPLSRWPAGERHVLLREPPGRRVRTPRTPCAWPAVSGSDSWSCSACACWVRPHGSTVTSRLRHRRDRRQPKRPRSAAGRSRSGQWGLVRSPRSPRSCAASRASRCRPPRKGYAAPPPNGTR